MHTQRIVYYMHSQVYIVQYRYLHCSEYKLENCMHVTVSLMHVSWN